jgi:CubicO group peptidase (beta-lactamase class C family)
MIVWHGKIVDAWGPTDRKISSFSVRKSLISALYGIYTAEGVIDPSATLGQLGIDDAPNPLTAQEKHAKVVDLLRSRSGVYHPVDFETKAQVTGRPARDSHSPGTFWFYNNWDFNALGTIFEMRTHRSIGDAFYERIARPIGMQDFKPSDVYYMPGPLSIHRAYHFEISARDLARFGVLYLNRGRWRDGQIVPAEWVDRSSHASEMVSFNGVQAGAGVKSGGYEYLWWVEVDGVHFPGVTVPPGTFSARGAGGHLLVIVPAMQLVVVHRFDNEPVSHEVRAVLDAAYKGITTAQFGPLLKLILDAAPR